MTRDTCSLRYARAAYQIGLRDGRQDADDKQPAVRFGPHISKTMRLYASGYSRGYLSVATEANR